MKIIWSKDFEIGIEKIDNQHRQLVELINKLDLAHRSSLSEGAVLSVFDELRNYTNYHFTFEEMLMHKNSFPELENHKNYHKDFMRKIREFYHDYSHHEPHALRETLDYLNDWLISHIMVEDTKYAQEILSPVSG